MPPGELKFELHMLQRYFLTSIMIWDHAESSVASGRDEVFVYSQFLAQKPSPCQLTKETVRELETPDIIAVTSCIRSGVVVEYLGAF